MRVYDRWWHLQYTPNRKRGRVTTAELEWLSASEEGRYLRGTISIVFTWHNVSQIFPDLILKNQLCETTWNTMHILLMICHWSQIEASVGLPKWLMWSMAFDQLCSGHNVYTKSSKTRQKAIACQQKHNSRNLYSVNIPNSLVLLLCFSSVLATAPDAALLWPLLPRDTDWQTDEEGVVIKHAWSSTCLLLWRWFCSIYNVWEQKHMPHILCNCKIRMSPHPVMKFLASHHYMTQNTAPLNNTVAILRTKY